MSTVTREGGIKVIGADDKQGTAAPPLFLRRYLPEVASEQGWTREEAVASLVRKAGYNKAVNRDLLKLISTTRYKSSKCRVSYATWVATRSL